MVTSNKICLTFSLVPTNISGWGGKASEPLYFKYKDRLSSSKLILILRANYLTTKKLKYI
ncbi:hypothetical protein GCM10010465_15740 [Actinomadura fibrosa]